MGFHSRLPKKKKKRPRYHTSIFFFLSPTALLLSVNFQTCTVSRDVYVHLHARKKAISKLGLNGRAINGSGLQQPQSRYMCHREDSDGHLEKRYHARSSPVCRPTFKKSNSCFPHHHHVRRERSSRSARPSTTSASSTH